MVGWTLKPAQRAMFVDKLPDAANLALRGMVFGQYLAPRTSLTLAAFGMALWGVLMAWAAFLAKED